MWEMLCLRRPDILQVIPGIVHRCFVKKKKGRVSLLNEFINYQNKQKYMNIYNKASHDF